MTPPADELRSAPEPASEQGGLPRTLHFSIWIACTLLLLGELLIDKHGETEIEHLFGFHAVSGAVAAFVLVLVAHLLRRTLSRPENYYDDR